VRLTPLDIKRQQFKKSMRGYDTAEVNIFLEMLSGEYESLTKQNSALLDKVSEMENELREYKQIEKTLQQTLLQAQDMANKTVESAKSEAGMILNDAEYRAAQIMDKAQLEANNLKQNAAREAAQIIEKAQREAGNIRNEADFVRSQKESLLNSMRTLLLSQLDMLKSLEKEEPPPERQPEVVPTVVKEEEPIPQQQVEPVKEKEPLPEVEPELAPAPLSEPVKREPPQSALEIDEIVKRLEQTFNLLDNPPKGTTDDRTQKED